MPYSLVINRKFPNPVHGPFEAEHVRRAAPGTSMQPASPTCRKSVSKIASGTTMADSRVVRSRMQRGLEGRKSPSRFFEIRADRTGYGLLVLGDRNKSPNRSSPRGVLMSPDRSRSTVAKRPL